MGAYAGVFSNVISPSTKAKLRLLFEVAPLALLVEKAGGESSCDGKRYSEPSPTPPGEQKTAME